MFNVLDKENIFAIAKRYVEIDQCIVYIYEKLDGVLIIARRKDSRPIGRLNIDYGIYACASLTIGGNITVDKYADWRNRITFTNEYANGKEEKNIYQSPKSYDLWSAYRDAIQECKKLFHSKRERFD